MQRETEYTAQEVAAMTVVYVTYGHAYDYDAQRWVDGDHYHQAATGERVTCGQRATSCADTSGSSAR